MKKWLLPAFSAVMAACNCYGQQSFTVRIAFDSIRISARDTLLYQHGNNYDGEIKFRSGGATTKYIFTAGRFIKKIGYYPGNQKMMEYELEEGRLNGVFKKWNRQGTLIISGYYKNGFADSTWTYFYRNGKKESEGNYLADPQYFLNDFTLVNATFEPAENQQYPKFPPPHGKWMFYNPDGERVKTLIFDKGIIRQLEVGGKE
ncbi:MAG: hypothetical protein U0T73_13825 [Chitinophagales bacterium]